MDQKQIDRLNELAASDAAVPGLSTGLGDLDLAISGLNQVRPDPAGRPARHGKDLHALNILLHAASSPGRAWPFSPWR